LTEGPAAPEDQKRGWTAWRVIAVCAFLVIAGSWAWLLSPLNDPTHPDELDDTAFLADAEARCEVFLEEIDALPKANTVNSPAERAPLVDQGTTLTVVLVEDLRSIAPLPDSDDGAIVAAWLADWEIYITDRNDYAAALRDGETGPFPVSARDGEQITEYIDGLSTVNPMPSCVVPLDV